MDKEKVAAILDEIGTLLALQGENPFRCNAYHNAARAILQLEEDIGRVVREGRLKDVPGIGSTLQEKITTLVTTGRLPFYEELQAKTPAGLLELLKLPSLGPKKVKALYEELGVDSPERLKSACEEGKVASLKGFGAKTQQKILEGLEFLNRMGQRVRLDEALALATALIERVREFKGVIRYELCGSLRRRRETIADIDILVSSTKPKLIMDQFVELPGIVRVLAKGDTRSSVEVDRGVRGLTMQADLRVVTDEQFPFAQHYFTGSKEHNIAMRARAQQYGLKLNEYELSGPKKRIACKEEADIFAALDLDYIPPELREMTGEIEAAAEHRLPVLIEEADLRGTFHCHTNWSDGHNSLEEMVQRARQIGLEYFGIGDHSQSLTVARGLTPERIKLQHAEIDKLQKKFKDIRILKGTECDILPDGSLDFSDEVLSTFDYVVASVHTHFNLSESEMTARIIKALSHPKVTMLGHATGRLLLQRDGYKVDLEAVLQAAKKHNKMIEINAHPRRLDLDWIHCKRAKALGIPLVINPDAHSTADISLLSFGVSVARRGWLEKENVFNTKPVKQVIQELKRRMG
ncbi:MAG: DNA polymerase/3'-5' exonuclease PolX [Gemmatales bacterium]|nr:MAG: DNA polymerase/3'-5' exonuclease PolX [Gemmatales bacterium]